MLDECYRVQFSPTCKITPEETEAGQRAQDPKAGRGGTETRIPSPAFYPQSPAVFPCPHSLLLSLLACDGCQVIETPPGPEIAPSPPSPPLPAFPVAKFVTHGHAH